MPEPEQKRSPPEPVPRGTADERSVAAVVFTWVLVIATVALAVWQTRAPEPVSADAPPGVFSAERAMRHVEAMAAEPHPTGSEANAQVRQYLVDELRALGLEPEVTAHEADPPPWAAQRGWEIGRTVTVHNIQARLPGHDEPPTEDTEEEKAAGAGVAGAGVAGAVLLAAHYDSVPTGPGAADDAAGVAAILETLRALQHRQPLPNDVLVLLTDGEELGLLGAKAFVRAHPSLPERIGVVLNFEARGTSGPSLMFETSLPNAELVRHFAEAAPLPLTTSLATDVYRRLPNDTDFTVFREAGLSGLNFAFIDGASRYHTPLDDPEHLSRGSLQHHGSHMLSLAEHFGRLEPGEMEQIGRAGGGDAVYFTLMPGWLVVYPQLWLWPLAGVLAAGFVATVGLAVRAGRVSVGALGAGSGLALGVLLTVPAAVGLLVAVLPFSYPTEASMFPAEDQSRLYLWGFAGLVVAVISAVLVWLRRRAVGSDPLHLGVVGWCVVLAVLSSASLPGGSYLFVWPGLLGLLSYWSRATEATGWPAVLMRRGMDALVVGGAVLLYVPVVELVGVALGVRKAAAPMFLLVLMLGLLTPQVWTMTRRWPWLLPGATGAAGVALLVAGVVAG